MYTFLHIRPIEKNDTQNILCWRNSPEVVKNFIYRKNLTEAEHENWLNTYVATGKVAQFIIEVGDEKLPVGSVYLRDIDYNNKKAEFGIFIGEEFARGKGYGAQATRLILKYAFETMDLNKVFLRVFADNKRAINCYLNAGFKEDGLFRDDVCIDGKFYDVMFMSILNSEWKERK